MICVLYKLIGLEIDVLMKEHEETLKNIARYTDILNNYGSMAEVIIERARPVQKGIRPSAPHDAGKCRGSCSGGAEDRGSCRSSF